MNVSFLYGLYSIFTSSREKQEATQSFLTSWPSDMIGSVLLPSQTKGFWKQSQLMTWPSCSHAQRRGEGECVCVCVCLCVCLCERERESNHVLHNIYLFKMSICWALQLGWYINTHLSLAHKLSQGLGKQRLLNPIYLFSSDQIAMIAYSYKKVVETQP